jgi:hypothetical protein
MIVLVQKNETHHTRRFDCASQHLKSLFKSESTHYLMNTHTVWQTILRNIEYIPFN